MRPEGSLPVVGKVRDHARLEGNFLNLARHIAQILRIAVDLGPPHKRVVVHRDPDSRSRRLQVGWRAIPASFLIRRFFQHMLKRLAHFSLQSALTISMLQCSKELGLNAFGSTSQDQPQRSLMIRIDFYGFDFPD
jgi:hypothetical protein